MSIFPISIFRFFSNTSSHKTYCIRSWSSVYTYVRMFEHELIAYNYEIFAVRGRHNWRHTGHRAPSTECVCFKLISDQIGFVVTRYLHFKLTIINWAISVMYTFAGVIINKYLVFAPAVPIIGNNKTPQVIIWHWPALKARIYERFAIIYAFSANTRTRTRV